MAEQRAWPDWPLLHTHKSQRQPTYLSSERHAADAGVGREVDDEADAARLEEGMGGLAREERPLEVDGVVEVELLLGDQDERDEGTRYWRSSRRCGACCDGLDGAEDLCSFGNVNVPVEGLPRPGLGDLSRNFLAILVLDVQRVDYGGLPDKYSDGRCSEALSPSGENDGLIL